MGGISPSAAARFMIRFRSKIIERLSLPVQIADYLLDKKVLSDELYQRICDASSSQDQVRKLYHASSGNLAKFHFYKALEKCDPFLFKSLKAKEKKNMKKREGSAPSDDQPSAKRPRTQEAAATAAGAEQNQGREARNEGEPGSRLKFRTFSEMEEHIKDPTVREELIKKLKMKLEGGEVERLERLLAEMKLKTPVCFDHKAVREIQTNQVVRAFLLPGEKKKFPFLVTKQCFIKIRGLAPQGSNAKDLAETQEGQEWSHGNPRNSANIKKNIARCQNMLSPPSAEPCSAVQDARAYSTPIGQGTPFGSNAHTFSRREQEDSVTELSARGDSLSSSGYGSLILHPTEEAAGEASCTGPATPPAANQQLPQTPATPPAANQQLPQTPATPPAANSQLFGTPAEGDGSQQVSNGPANTSASGHRYRPIERDVGGSR
ncbi:uncharacterized protein LOC118792323 [Megalops cyprinoides]|uniref:uncharacterized protein LOC118792323 n=1 Tax=Megalops cyprinoides TaxID=118141 RepID=UPI001865540F|nr:uncharacterized protein LOC118792323 [Megalops cyprinoides]